AAPGTRPTEAARASEVLTRGRPLRRRTAGASSSVWPYRDFFLELGACLWLWLQTPTDHRSRADGTSIALARVSGARRQRIPAGSRGVFHVAEHGRPLRRLERTRRIADDCEVEE